MQLEYYLVTAARRVHRLRQERSYAFGRDPALDIVLQDALVSRRHAELRWNADSWEIVDLASRNGVMVNGQRVEGSRKLDDTDQVQIGGQVLRFHLLPTGGDPNSLWSQAPEISNVETMGPGLSLTELAGQGAAFTGALTDGMFEMLQFLQQTRKSGRLDLLGSGLGSVWVDAGNPVHASFNGQEGMDALLEMTKNPPPRFAFHAEAAPEQRTLRGSANAVLMELARLSDESAR